MDRGACLVVTVAIVEGDGETLHRRVVANERKRCNVVRDLDDCRQQGFYRVDVDALVDALVSGGCRRSNRCPGLPSARRGGHDDEVHRDPEFGQPPTCRLGIAMPALCQRAVDVGQCVRHGFGVADQQERSTSHHQAA